MDAAQLAPDDIPRLVYQDEILAAIGCSRPTFNREISSGAFPPGRIINGRVAWLASEVTSYIENLPRQRFTGKRGRPRGQTREMAG